MKKLFLFVLFIFICMPVAQAQRGCCSHHGGVSGCSSNGRQVCNDGTLSPSCTCTPSYIYGCTDRNARNYNSGANKNDGSCLYYVAGCTDSSAKNYNSGANKNDGSCLYYVVGCTDSNAINYNSSAEKDDGSCIKKVPGCMDAKALNYNEEANASDDSCEYKKKKVKKLKNTVSSKEKEEAESNNVGAGVLGLGVIGASVYGIRKKIYKKKWKV